MIARGEEALSATAAEVHSLGGQPVVLKCDVADPQAVEAAAGELEQHGGIEVWVNNAMASVFAPTWEITAEESPGSRRSLIWGWVRHDVP